MSRISAGNNVVAYDSQTDVQFISMRRVDSQGNLTSLDRVVNRPVVSARPRPNAPPLPRGDFRADFTGSRSAGGIASPDAARGAHLRSFDMPAQTDGASDVPPPYSATQTGVSRGAPPPYSASDIAPHYGLPSAPLPDSPPAYSPPSLEWYLQHGYPSSAV
ncbi:hypothetical protein [Pandoraea communis]|uniref:Uncharacterized protein n=1 Tax=Pandoraea communis TaxID=2508297 RepID=A0A5E4S878_9BURK|nr:hypothetical protein [Pandoraea communis]MDM8354640.1 hypothetical protein [Pandoraea communis]VVD71002.1 hypothetical protein PCO31111_00617 [Pandoraea communis]